MIIGSACSLVGAILSMVSIFLDKPTAVIGLGVMSVGAIYFGACLVRTIRYNRWRAGKCCLTCGYNLTGNTSGVCPECGTAIHKHRRRKRSRQP